LSSNLIWRFYTDDSGRWKWQRLNFDRSVFQESKSAHKEYDACVADAHAFGYVQLPSVSTRLETNAPRPKRPYVRLSR
jgi:hypothetical protein